MSNVEKNIRKSVPPKLRSMIALALLLAAPALVLVDALVLRGCAGSPDSVVSDDAMLTVSGAIVDGEGRALQGVIISIAGPAQATATTGANGTYLVRTSAKVGTGDSWSIQ